MNAISQLVTQLTKDAALAKLTTFAFSQVQLTMEKAVAHIGKPADFPMPDDPTSLEHIFVRSIRRIDPELRDGLISSIMPRVDSTGSARVAIYHGFSAANFRLNTPMTDQAAALAVPVDVSQAATNLRARIKPPPSGQSQRLRRERPVTAGPVVSRARHGGATNIPSGDALDANVGVFRDRLGLGEGVLGLGDGGTDHLILSVDSVHCARETSERGKDEIDFAALLFDFSTGAATSVGPTRVGKFKTGTTHAVPNGSSLHRFKLPKDGLDHTYLATFFLAEKDWGGFRNKIEQVSALPDRELCGEIAAAMAGIVTLLVLGTAATAHAVGTLTLAGVAVAVVELLTAVLLAAVAFGLVYTVVELVPRWLKDEIFPPVTVGQAVLFNHRFVDATTETPSQKAIFEGFGGKYEVNYRFRVTLEPGGAADERPKETLVPAANEREARRNLSAIDHIVVLMLENRSFDHMLGYLSLESGRDDVDGLLPSMSNPLRDVPFVGQAVADKPIFHLDAETTPNGRAPTAAFFEDPAHGFGSVLNQIGSEVAPAFRNSDTGEFVLPDGRTARDMKGFVDSYRGVLDKDFPGSNIDPGMVMGYYNAVDVPAYDFLAREFCVCDRWFSSFVGPTWVNRLFALTGRGFGITSNSIFHKVNTLFHELEEENVDFKWYFHDWATLRNFDPDFRLAPSRYAPIRKFFEDVRDGKLKPVTWIDPNYVDLGNLGEGVPHPQFDPPAFPDTANDDHPPTDVSHAQALVNAVFWSLYQSELWDKTLFVVLYDEHGGFHDHVAPDDIPAGAAETYPDGLSDFGNHYGPRVPALVVSPRVGRQTVAKLTFDHTSLVKTILTRFCPNRIDNPPAADKLVPSNAARVQAATHLGYILKGSGLRFGEIRATSGLPTTQEVGMLVHRNLLKQSLSTLIMAARARKVKNRKKTELELQIEEAKSKLGQPVGTTDRRGGRRRF